MCIFVVALEDGPSLLYLLAGLLAPMYIIGDEESIIASVVESRSREVAIAVMSSHHLYLLRVYLLTDTQSYSETIDLLEYLSPHEVIVPER